MKTYTVESKLGTSNTVKAETWEKINGEVWFYVNGVVVAFFDTPISIVLQQHA